MGKGIPTSPEEATGLSAEELRRLGYSPKKDPFTGKPVFKAFGPTPPTQQEEDFSTEGAAKSMLLRGAKDRTGAAESAADRFRGLEKSSRTKAAPHQPRR